MVSRNPFDLISNPTPAKWPRGFRGVITAVNKDIKGQLALTYSVKPVTSTITTGDAVFSNVLLISPGVSPLDVDSASPLTGMFYFPEVGCNVWCEYDGTHWCIKGFYSGPAELLPNTASSNNLYVDALKTPSSFLPWFDGIDSGDIVLGKDNARVKLNKNGLILSGAGPDACVILTADKRMLTRCGQTETFTPGIWETNSTWAGDTYAAIHAAIDSGLAGINNTTASYSCRLIESGVGHGLSLRPFNLIQAGHISPTFEALKQKAVLAELGGLQTAAEVKSKMYYAYRHSIEDKENVIYRTSVSAMGDWQTSILKDFTTSYNTLSRIYSFNTGRTSSLSMSPVATVLTTPAFSITAGTVDITTSAVTLKAADVNITGVTNIQGTLNVSSVLSANMLKVGRKVIVSGPVIAAGFREAIIPGFRNFVVSNASIAQAVRTIPSVASTAFTTALSTFGGAIGGDFLTPLSSLPVVNA